MAKLDDITIYCDSLLEINLSTEDFLFRRMSSYLCDLYHHNLNGYKPIKTSRINVTISSFEKNITSNYFGSICLISGSIDEDKYLGLNHSQKFRYLLDILHTSIMSAVVKYSWDETVFRLAYEKVLTSEFKFRVELPTKIKNNVGQFTPVVEKDLKSTFASIHIVTPKIDKTVLVFTKENISCHDNAMLLCSKLKWFNKDEIGLELKANNIKLTYNLITDKLDSNLKFSAGNIYWE